MINGTAEQLRAFGREVARGIPETVLLLERAVVFFVDDDQAERRERHEDRAARADQNARVPVATLHATFARRSRSVRPE